MTEVPVQQAVSTSGWKKAAKHFVLCPSGVRVGIKIPNLAAMIEAGEIPNHLLEAALGAAGDAAVAKTPTKEMIVQQREFTDVLTMLTVVEPKLTQADLPDLPFEDKEFLVAVAMRQRDVDAEGEHIGGLSTSEKFRRFRGLGEFDQDLEGA